MAGSLNKVILIGHLGRDPELNYSPNGTAVATMSVATNEGYTKQNGEKVEKTEWHRVVAFKAQADFIGNYLGKGRLVSIEGKLQTRKWQDQNGNDRYTTEIVAQRVTALDKAPQNQQPNGYQPQHQGGYQQQSQQGGSQQPQQSNHPYQNQQVGYQQPQQGGYSQYNGQSNYGATGTEDLGPAFPSEASGMDDVPF